MPCPACSVTSSATEAPGAAAVIAAASGWVLCCSSAAAHASACASVVPSAVRTAVTTGSFRVRVPVLSTATWRITPKRSNAASRAAGSMCQPRRSMSTNTGSKPAHSIAQAVAVKV